MTISYTHEVAECRGLGNFWRLLFRWKGSIYKLVWPDLFVYSFFYFFCSAIYRFLLNEPSRRIFEKVSIYCNHFSDLIPVSFVLGFYVSIVIQRWWAQYETLPWPDSLSLFISTSIQGQDDRGRLMRRTIVRYLNLAFTITLTMITSRAKKRFPTLDHLVEAGFMTPNEKKVYDRMEQKTNHPLYWLPLVWAGSVVARARKENRIRDDFAVKTIIDEINNFRGKCGGLLSYDWISIPLVYTQVVSLAVYSFFLSTIMGRQFLDPEQKIPHNDIDFYLPVFTLLQFFFYMGWLKVAESLVNPFGEDDDDFEVNYLIDRNLQISYMIVDEMHDEHPELIQDIYWDEVFPQELPYTVAAEQFRRDPFMGSTAVMEVPEAEQEFLPVLDEEPEEDDNDDPEKGTSNVFKKIGSLLSVGSSHQSGRKNSVLSFFPIKLFRSDNNKTPEGSMLSINRSRGRGLNRSASRTSAGSYLSHMSEDSLPMASGLRSRPISILKEGKYSPNMNTKDVRGSPSANVSNRERKSASSPHSSDLRRKRNESTSDSDSPILIRIKRSDNTGKKSDDHEKELFIYEEEEEDTNVADSIKPISTGTSSDVNQPVKKSEASNDKGGLLRSNLSQCSISTNIFTDVGNDPREEDTREEEGSDDAAKPLLKKEATREKCINPEDIETVV